MFDCESLTSACKSLCDLCGVTAEHLELHLRGTSFDDLDEFSGGSMSYGEAIVKFTEARLHVPLKNARVERAAFFHLSRTWPGERFEEGILPLGPRLVDRMWDRLEETARNFGSVDLWRAFRREGISSSGGHSAWLYRFKTKDPFHWGPYAILVRDIALQPEVVGNHDYLAIPEIVEDICRAFKEYSGIDILPEVVRTTRPCIVKFSASPTDLDVVSPCLYYLFCLVHAEPLSIWANTCYDGRGTMVPPGDIIRVEFPQYIPRRFASNLEG